MSHKIHIQNYHYIFIGAGASSTLLLLKLDECGLLDEKRILIIDPDRKEKNDRTFCFWAEGNEPYLSTLKHSIYKKWSKLRIDSNQIHSIENNPYLYIRGIDIYSKLKQVIEKHSIVRIHSKVTHIEHCENQQTVYAENEKWNGAIIFDSRPPIFEKPRPHESHIYQSFVGYFIKTEAKLEHHVVDLMDFNVPQKNEVQFMYVLPLNDHEALVELTNFGKTKVLKAEAEPILEKYISDKFGPHQILDIEIGCIPMSTSKITNNKNVQTIINIGARAGAIKPSTGYAFKNMCIQAEIIAHNLLKNNEVAPITRKKRFLLYDRLLLKIIENNPQKARKIFQILFAKNDMMSVLKFLDEKTTITEDAKIFASLPIPIFLIKLFSDKILRAYKHSTYWFLILVSSSFLILQNINNELFKTTQITMGLIGLLLIGIPHGALDHILERGTVDYKSLPSFISTYLFKSAIFLASWLIAPTFALIFFVIFSIWHFGNTDIQEWQITDKSFSKSWFWGTLVLGLILVSHLEETNLILTTLKSFPLDISTELAKNLSTILIGLGVIFSVLEKNLKILLLTFVLTICCKLPLLTAFGIYFIGQHSINGWRHLNKGLKMSHFELTKQSLPFTVGAIMLFGLLSLYIKSNFVLSGMVSDQLASIFFIFIGCISFPHVLAMNRFYQKKKI